MTRYFLKNISIEGFRGINNEGIPLIIEFDPNKVTSIFGRNGSGKSSTFEAITYALTGEIPRLSKMQQVENPSNYYLNKFHKGSAIIQLELVADDDIKGIIKITVERDQLGNRSITSKDTLIPELIIEEIFCETLLLDYNTFNDFVMSKPLDRGREFSKLLGLNKISNFKSAFDALSDTRGFNTDTEIVKLKGILIQTKKTIIQYAESACRSLSKILEHKYIVDTFDPDLVRQESLDHLKSNQVIGEFFKERRLESVDYSACRKRVDEKEGGVERKRLQKLINEKSQLETIIDISSFNSITDNLLERINQRTALLGISKGEDFKALFEAASRINKTEWSNDKCPLCESNWQHPSGLCMSNYVDLELKNFEDVIALEIYIRSEWEDLLKNEIITTVQRALKNIGSLQAAASTVIDLHKAVIPSEADINYFKISLALLEEQRSSVLKDLEQEIQTIEKTLPSSLVDLVYAITGAEELSKTLLSFNKEKEILYDTQVQLDAINEWHQFIKEAANEFALVESTIVKQTLANIELDIRMIYNEIMQHPEVLPKLLRDDNSERVFLQLERFFGIDSLDAVPLLSESYRNALGLSVFLAASRNRKYGGRFIILDDVTSSFDSGHQHFLISAIYKHIALPQNSSGLQVIILSHDGLLEKFFDQASISGWEWTSTKLQGLPPNGIIYGGQTFGPRVKASLDQRIAIGDVEGSLPLIRQYLEFKFTEVIRELQIRVPLDFSIRDDKRMVRNLIEVIRHEIDIYHRMGEIIVSPTNTSILRDSLIPSLLGNFVQHYETGSTASFTPYFIKGIVDQIDNLARCFQYTCNCSTAPRTRYFRTLTTKQKGCGTNCM